MLRIRPMTVDDLPFGMKLKEQAGWNQLEADWRRLLDLEPAGSFLAERDGTPAGTVTTCRFGAIAWVAMMLVGEAFRSQGIGRALMTAALDDLEGRGIPTVRLDATPMGRPLYESLGFVEESTFARCRGVFPRGPAADRPPEVVPGERFESIAALDREVTGTDRGRLLARLAQEYPRSLRMRGRGRSLDGFLMARPGIRAWQIGPCIADASAGPRLLEDALEAHEGGAAIIDVPTAHPDASAVAESLGFRRERLLTRMVRGEPVQERPAWIWASAGPEKG